MQYSVVVPCYRSGPWLGELVERTEKVFGQMGESFEIILVNDASPDEVTWKTIRDLAADHESVHGIDLLANVGQFRALMAGMEASKGEFVITMDDDLQHLPEEIPKLTEKIRSQEGVQAVIGAYDRKRHGRFRNLGTRLIGWIYTRAYGKPKDLSMSSFRILRRPVVDAILAHRTVRPVFGALLLQSTTRIENVQIRHEARPHGSSGYRIGRLVSATMDNIVNMSVAPLRAFSLIGMLSALLAMMLGIYYLIRALTGSIGVAGFPTVVLLVIFFGGMMLAAIGVVGEYVARVVTEVTGPPRYVIRERVD